MTALTNAPAVLDADASHAASFASWLRSRIPGVAFTADDIRPWAEIRQLSGSQIGGLFRGAAEAGAIRHIGWRPSKVESNRGRQLQVWELA